MFIKIRKY